MRIMTPVETEVASASAVFRAVRKINDRLANGQRSAIVEPGILAAVTAAIESAGWAVESRPCDGDSENFYLTISSRVA